MNFLVLFTTFFVLSGANDSTCCFPDKFKLTAKIKYHYYGVETPFQRLAEFAQDDGECHAEIFADFTNQKFAAKLTNCTQDASITVFNLDSRTSMVYVIDGSERRFLDSGTRVYRQIYRETNKGALKPWKARNDCWYGGLINSLNEKAEPALSEYQCITKQLLLNHGNGEMSLDQKLDFKPEFKLLKDSIVFDEETCTPKKISFHGKEKENLDFSVDMDLEVSRDISDIPTIPPREELVPGLMGPLSGCENVSPLEVKRSKEVLEEIKSMLKLVGNPERLKDLVQRILSQAMQDAP